MDKTKRAFELDALRGLALFGMILHHLIYDFRYMLGLNIFAFQDSNWFLYIVRPAFIVIFLVVSGICCQFSRNNIRRAVKLFAVALLFSVAMGVVSVILNEELYVFFNVLHLLTVGTLLYGIFTIVENRMIRKSSDQKKTDGIAISTYGDVILILFASILFYASELIPVYSSSVKGYWLLPFGFLPKDFIGMGDYMPIFPWLGFFIAGVVIGRLAYRQKHSIFPNASKTLRGISVPFEWLGRNSLIIYVFHQPLLLAILFGLRYLGVW